MDNREKFAHLQVHDFKAIKSANIDLCGITVVSGINGCGKSTLSQFIYYIYLYWNQYETLAYNKLKNTLSPFIEAIYLMNQMSKLVGNVMAEERQLFYMSTQTNDFKSYETFIHKQTEAFLFAKNDLPGPYSRVVRVLQELLKTKNNEVEELVQELECRIQNTINNTQKKIGKRVYGIFNDALESVYNKDLFEKIKFEEYGEEIVGQQNKTTVPLPHVVKKIMYIDTPMILGRDSFFMRNAPSYWDHLNMMLKGNGAQDMPSTKYLVNDFIQKKEILNGTSFYDKESGTFIYKNESIGNDLNLLECATGVKSFSILQILLNNGSLTKSSMLVIDEPEVHLHPQWIIEYAKVIVLLHKHIGVKFFIASHNPDMISAIKYISEKENVVDSVSFYLAEKDSEDDSAFNFTLCGADGHDIEPIFNSFNKSYEKLNSYTNEQ